MLEDYFENMRVNRYIQVVTKEVLRKLVGLKMSKVHRQRMFFEA